MEIIPKTGLRGLRENWQSDLIAAISVAMVALPLALGIALASGLEPISGILSAAIGGIVTTFFRGSHVAINGPAAGLIAVILGSTVALNDGSGNTLNYVFAAIVVSGALQVLLGLFKLGRFGDIFHASVIHGILAAIGIIIFAKQIHVAFDTTPSSTKVLNIIGDFFSEIPNINPFVATISILGLILMIFHSKINYKLFHFLPAPFWVLILSIPLVYAFNFFEPHAMTLFGNDYNLGPDLLVKIPDNILDAIAFPNFSKINTLPFWVSVISITMIASIETIASTKAVDKLDPYKRRTNLNKDLVGIGMSTMVSGMLGGLPIITVIVRSTVNVHNNAKTKWSNLYHGLIILVFIFLLAPIIQQIPLSALAIILVYTGYKLASPKVIKHVYDQGIEQLIFFMGTLIITLLTNLLYGIVGGLLLVLITHLLLARVPVITFFQMVFKSGTKLKYKKDGSYDMEFKGIANFLGMIGIDKLLSEIKPNTKVSIDLSETRLVDISVLEGLQDFVRRHESTGGEVIIFGLENHVSSSKHKLALKILASAPSQMTNRQTRLLDLANEHGWSYQNISDIDIDLYETFYFFKSRPIEHKLNCIYSTDKNSKWQISDLIFEEGAFIVQEEYKTTLALVEMPFKIPKFTIEKKGFLEKYLIPTHKDIDYLIYPNFSDDFIVKVENIEEMDSFLNDALKTFLEQSESHHLESNGEAILIFNDRLKIAKIKDYPELVDTIRVMSKNIIKQ